MIIPIKYKVGWELISHRKQVQINKDNIRVNNIRIEYDYKVGGKMMLNKNAAYKCETPYEGPFVRT